MSDDRPLLRFTATYATPPEASVGKLTMGTLMQIGSPYASGYSAQTWPPSPDELAQLTNDVAAVLLPDAPFGQPGTLTLERLRELADDNLDAALLLIMADRAEDEDKPGVLEKIRLALVAREMERRARGGK